MKRYKLIMLVFAFVLGLGISAFASLPTRLSSMHIGVGPSEQSETDAYFESDRPVRFDDGINMIAVYLDIAAASATAYDSGQAISTTTLVSGTTTLLLANADYTDIITPRNVVAVVGFASGVASTTVTGTMLITGTDATGDSTTETLTISTTSATGNVAWRTITSCAWTVTAVSGRATADDALLKLGSGTKIGLPNTIIASGNIAKVIEAGALTTTATVDTTYNTVTFVNAPDGSKDYQVWYIFKKR